MDYFELVSQYAPTVDQPQAIEELVKGFKEFFPNNAVEYFVSYNDKIIMALYMVLNESKMVYIQYGSGRFETIRIMRTDRYSNQNSCKGKVTGWKDRFGCNN